MCNDCQTLTRYADIYNEAFAARDRTEWLDSKLRSLDNTCLIQRAKLLKHISTALATQRIFGKIKTSHEPQVSRSIHCLRKMKLMRTRRLARRMLSHTYRPGGYMFGRLLEQHKMLFPARGASMKIKITAT